MSASAPNHALRRLVADLAALHADDIAAVLGDLDGAERQKIEGLLREYAAHFERTLHEPVEERSNYDPFRFAPWLIQRLEGTPDCAMTPEARRTLRDCAQRLYPLPSAQASSPVSASMSLFGRMASVFPQRRQAT